MSGARGGARGRVARLHLVMVAVVVAAASLGACSDSDGGGSVNVMGTAKSWVPMSDVETGKELLLWGGRRTEPGITFVSANDGSRFVP